MNLTGILADHNPWWRDPALRRSRHSARRALEPLLLERIGPAGGRRAIVVVGPRQVGKSVMLRQLADDLITNGWPPQNVMYFDFEDDRIVEPISAREVINVEPIGMVSESPRVFLLDEISKSVRWAEWLKQAVDRNPQYRIVVTDSVATILREQGRESGLGRWDEYILEPLTFPEFLDLQSIPREDALLGAQNPFESYLAKSGFPEHLWSEDYPQIRARLRSDIADRAILKDLARTGVDVEQVRSLFVYLMQDSGAIFSVSSRAKDLKVDERSIRKWARLLQDTLLVHDLPLHQASRASAASRLGAKPKLYAADHGLVISFSLSPDPLADPEVRGKAFEALVFHHLRTIAKALEARLGYFRDSKGLEADFILDSRGGRVVVEVTHSAAPRDRVGKVREVARQVGAAVALVVHGGIAQESTEEVRFVPIQKFCLDPLSFLQGGNP